jgi:hypothetical protein
VPSQQLQGNNNNNNNNNNSDNGDDGHANNNNNNKNVIMFRLCHVFSTTTDMYRRKNMFLLNLQFHLIFNNIFECLPIYRNFHILRFLNILNFSIKLFLIVFKSRVCYF